VATAHPTPAEAAASGGIETIPLESCDSSFLAPKCNVLTACRNGVVSSTAQVGKAGSKPALPRNCGEQSDDGCSKPDYRPSPMKPMDLRG
jgi:hypothetical protein